MEKGGVSWRQNGNRTENQNQTGNENQTGTENQPESQNQTGDRSRGSGQIPVGERETDKDRE